MPPALLPPPNWKLPATWNVPSTRPPAHLAALVGGARPGAAVAAGILYTTGAIAPLQAAIITLTGAVETGLGGAFTYADTVLHNWWNDFTRIIANANALLQGFLSALNAVTGQHITIPIPNGNNE